MANYLHRLDAIEQRIWPRELQYILAFANDGEEKDAVAADALRARGLEPGEARVIVISFVDPRPDLP